MGELDLSTLRVDGEIFESGKKKLRIQKYPDTCGRGLSIIVLASYHKAVLWLATLLTISVFCDRQWVA